jgi:hypothetical protein
MNGRGPVPVLVGATLIAAVLCTLVVEGGWLVWIPVLGALIVLARTSGTLRG